MNRLLDPAFRQRFPSSVLPRVLPAVLCAGAAALTPVAAAAQAAATIVQQVLPQVVITAADTEQPLARTIAHTTLISEAEIRRSGFADLNSLLRGVAGVDIAQSGGVGSTSSVFMRGAPGTQVLVLVDGQRVASATLGTAALDQIMLDAVDHIEIVRGNVSALYGSAAVGGVIQVFTRTGKGPARPQVMVEIGSHQTVRASAGVRGGVGDTGYALSLSGLRTDGFSAMDPAASAVINPDRDGYRNTSATASVTHKLGGGHQLGLRAYLSRGRAAYDSAWASAATDEHTMRSATTELSAFWSARWAPDWTSTLRVGTAKDESHATETTAGIAERTRFDTRTLQADFKTEWRPAPGQLAAVGLQSVRQAVDSTTAYDRTSRRIDSLTASYNGDHGVVQSQLALRHDRVSDSGPSASTGLIGLALPLNEAVRLTGTWSTAFNLPNFNQLYYPLFGNAALQPEKARSLELGAQYEASGVLAKAVWFRTRYRDLIDSPAPAYATINVNRAQSDGVELSASARLAAWTVKLNYTNQDPRDTTTGQILNRRADAFGGVEVMRDIGAWQLGGQVTSVSDRRDGTNSLAGYTLVHLNAHWKLLPEWTLRARVSNLLAERYQTVYGYNQPGREAFVGLSWQP